MTQIYTVFNPISGHIFVNICWFLQAIRNTDLNPCPYKCKIKVQET